MCGIAGFFGKFESSVLSRMSGVIAHRGPDSDATWHDQENGVGFAHRRLAIIDLSVRGNQPMWDVTGRLCIIYNGEMYNYLELKSELEADGMKFHSDCDTEVV